MSLPANLKGIDSVWSIHGYEEFFYSTVMMLKPKSILQFGVYQGHSLIAMAAALKDLGNGGTIVGVDLFDQYPFKHCSYNVALGEITACGVINVAALQQADMWELEPCPVDILHVDIPNDANSYRRIFKEWGQKVGKAIMLEGGSPERDKAYWMVKYNHPPIAPIMDELREQYPEWAISVMKPWPSLTVAVRK